MGASIFLKLPLFETVSPSLFHTDQAAQRREHLVPKLRHRLVTPAFGRRHTFLRGPCACELLGMDLPHQNGELVELAFVLEAVLLIVVVVFMIIIPVVVHLF